MSEQMLIFIGLVFVAAFFLSQGLIIPVFGENAKTRKLLAVRLNDITAKEGGEDIASILRERYLRNLSPVESWLESQPLMEALSKLIEQSGNKILAYRLILISLLMMIVGGCLGWFFTLMPVVALGGAILGAAAPFIKIRGDRTKRFEKFEEQLPDCIDIMRRALLAGHPFTTCLDLVAQDSDQPAAREFELTFSDMTYGNDVRRAMLGLLSRVPSVTVMALVTSVLVQKETGGNLAEILQQISAVIRDRFKFARKVKTMSAEGRMSAWVLAMVPLGLFAFLSFANPTYLPMMLEDPTGQQMAAFAALWSLLGVYVIRRIIRIDV
jgi:tight adherence protein B